MEVKRMMPIKTETKETNDVIKMFIILDTTNKDFNLTTQYINKMTMLPVNSSIPYSTPTSFGLIRSKISILSTSFFYLVHVWVLSVPYFTLNLAVIYSFF